MKTSIRKWGNSLGILIPNRYAREANLKEGAMVDITHKGRTIVIKKNKALSLDECLQKIDTNNLHSSVDTGSFVGNETW